MRKSINIRNDNYSPIIKVDETALFLDMNYRFYRQTRYKMFK